MCFVSQDLSTLDDQQRFDGLLEKVSLSALDPTDDELLDQTVDIISGGTYATIFAHKDERRELML